ncbi:ABC transporter permease subunit [Pseudohalocynthiibacter sp. F2068]|uniref:ABC transporter permease n=1 Tax=Pseudohalocynthiibacter sp. F2068 TaxID=2926418 RepID=UPI001FF6A550|nr:ABC transporter permease subunit [Pseudohalocynthiibacter sp. F2068]
MLRRSGKRSGRQVGLAESSSIEPDAHGSSLAGSSLSQSNLFIWSSVGLAVLVSLVLSERYPILLRIEEGAGLPIPQFLDLLMDWFVGIFKAPFRLFASIMELPIEGFRSFYLWLPWPSIVVFTFYLGYVAAGWSMAMFCGGSALYTLIMGSMKPAALTLAMISVSLPMSLSAGMLIGILSHRNSRARTILSALLDFMQTVPAFAYLIPLLILFGFGPTVGLIASAIYAIPPMAKNVLLGLSRVPADAIESATMSGASERQMLWQVKVPYSMPTIMIGVNQSILATLSMVVIAAVLGSGEDLGWDVLDKMRRAEFGKSLLAGVTIVLMAMVMDRVSQAFARKHATSYGAGYTWSYRAQILAILVITLFAFKGAALAFPALDTFPKSWVFGGGDAFDDVVSWININYPQVTTAIKNNVLFFFMLPLKLGLDTVVKPFSWGFEPTLAHLLGYLVGSAVLIVVTTKAAGWRVGLSLAYLSLVLLIGLTDLPWPAILIPVVVLAWQVVGFRMAVFAFGALVFMLVSGLWMRAMISVYLCGSAVIISLVLGLSLGVWSALSDRVSRCIRPVNDTLQSIPLFVFLIPVVGLFKVGEFAGLLAIIMYAIVPVIRYTEHGIRSVNSEVIEAGRVMGCTRSQLLFKIQLPLALPEIMLGINQTVLFGLAMLVVTALIGTKGLGQIIYQSLSTASFGLGISAGLSMAFIAIIIDRIIQTWSQRRKLALGIID